MIKPVIFYIGLLILIFFALIIILEIIFRIIDKILDTFYPDNPEDQFSKKYLPYVNYYTSWDDAMFDYDQIVGYRLFNKESSHYHSFAKINKLGFRTHEFDTKKNDEYVILFNGGSCAFGSGATSNENTIAYNLERKLNQISKKKIKVYNLAQLNNFQTQELTALIFFFNKIKPDLVISLNGWNELTANNIMSNKTIKEYEIFNIPEIEGWRPAGVNKTKKINFLSSAYIFFEENLNFLKYLSFLKPKNYIKRDRERKEYRNFYQSINDGSELYLKNLKIFSQLAKGFGFKYHSFLQPYITEKNKLSPDEKKFFNFRQEKDPLSENQNILSLLSDTKNIYKNIELKFDNLSNINLVNIHNLFADVEEEIFYSMVHVNDKGQEMISDIILENIKKDIDYE